MAKIQNIYAIASDGTKITVTASAVGAVPTDQVATSSVLGLIKTGDNTIQGQENGVDVNYLEVNAAGKGFMPAFNINKYFEAYKGTPYTFYKTTLTSVTSGEVLAYYITRIAPMDEYKDKGIVFESNIYVGNVFYKGSTGTGTSSLTGIALTKIDEGYTAFVYGSDSKELTYLYPLDTTKYTTKTEVITYDHYFAPETLNTYSTTEKFGIYFNLGNYTIEELQSTTNYYYRLKGIGNDFYDFCKNCTDHFSNFYAYDGDFSSYVSVYDSISEEDIKSYLIGPMGTAPVQWKAKPAEGTKTSNRVVLDATDPNIGIVDIDNFQHASTTQYGIMMYNSDYYEDDGTPKIATTDKQGTLKIGTEYSAYTTEGSYTAAPLLLNSDNVGYVEVLPATTTSIGSIMVSDSSIYDASTISNKTVAWVNLNDNRAFVYVNLASQQYRGSVRVQSKYTAYTTLDSQTAAYLRITDAGYGYVTVLPATTSNIGSFLASNAKSYEVSSTIGNTVAWVNMHTNNLAYVAIQPASPNMLGSVLTAAKYTAYSTEDSQTAAYLRINSAGKAYTPMLTETWTFTVLDDSDNETTVDKNVVLG